MPHPFRPTRETVQENAMTTKVREIRDSEASPAPASRRTRDCISRLRAAVVVFQLLSAVAACGQEAPPRADLPASLWFGMNSAVVRQRLEEQGAKLGKSKDSDDK